MPGFLVPEHFEKTAMTTSSLMIASIIFGITITFAVFSAATAARQTEPALRRSLRPTLYIYMIWGHLLANNLFGVVSFLYLRDVINASFWLWFFILVLWVFQSQLIVQIIANRLALLILVKSKARTLKLSILAIMTAINISVFIIWIPARLEINSTWVDINKVWDRIEKSIFLIVDAGLNAYFIYLVRHRLIANGLVKYRPLFRFNIAMIFISVSADVVLIGMMSLPNDLVYLQFQALAYGIKLHIEMNMADLIKKVVRASNINHDLSSGVGQRSSSAGLSKVATTATTTTNATTAKEASRRSKVKSNTNDNYHNNFIATITSGASQPPRGDYSIRIELGSTESLDLADDKVQVQHVEGLGGIQKTTVLTQTVDGRSDGHSDCTNTSSSELGLKE
ncbi:hypothetical protein GGR56DRAFT_683191 [Xylariaceae sp. FL0804]|nr:hypothetical protein GGR56DRAFT_683191 [Xylariaceae sp. FL0804]